MKRHIVTLLVLYTSFLFSQKEFKEIKRPILSYNYQKKMNNGLIYFQNKENEKPLNGFYEIDLYIEKKDVFDEDIVENENKRRTLKYDLANSKYKLSFYEEEGRIIKGYKTGLWKTTYKNKLVKIENWNKGLISGKYSFYDINGKIIYRTSFGSFGNGMYKDFYFRTGVLKEEGNYKNGKREGKWCEYNSKGILKKSTYFEKGIAIDE